MVNEFKRVDSETIEVNGRWEIDLGGSLGFQSFSIARIESDRTVLLNEELELVFWDQENNLDEIEENLKNGGDISLHGEVEVYPLV